ncbi:TPA: recombinase family protein [Vibrio parahaemolyticus]|nr:recombinase family protein [Vibrio parahaemolyticus]HCE3382595.1 recombinase family protein [Vibrio parahaemolyticus]
MNVAAYIRVSSQSQVTDGDSLEGQRLSIDKWAKENGHEVVKWYIEQGISAFSGVTRKEFNRLLIDIKANEIDIDAVVVYCLSRFSRTLLAQQQALKLLEDKNIRLLSVSQPLPEDPDTNSLMLAFIGLVDEQNSRQTSRTVCHRLADCARMGYFTGGPIPFGYRTVEVEGCTPRKKKKKKLDIESEEAKTVEKIFELSLRGVNGKPYGVKSIASYLNDNHATNRGRKWTTQTISKMLNNPVYYGEFNFRSRSGPLGTIEKIVVNVPSIITKKTFNSVKKGLESRELRNSTSKSYQSKSLLTGMLTCGKCRSKLVVVTGKSGKYKYYACHNKINKSVKSCDSNYIPKDDLDRKIISIFVDKILTKESIMDSKTKLKEIVKKRAKDNTHSISTLNSKKHKLELSVNIYLDKISNGSLIDSEMLNKYLNEKQSEIDSINNQIRSLSKLQEIPVKNSAIS